VAKVITRKKNRGGKIRKCGRCGEEILPGEKYFMWEPYSGPPGYRCYRHYPRQSELTTSKMSEVYSAIEAAEDWMGEYDGTDETDYNAQISQISEVVEQVQAEYEEAAQPFGGMGENQERAEMLEGFYSELEGADFEGFDDWWGSNCPDIVQEDAAQAWREDMNQRLSDVISNAP